MCSPWNLGGGRLQRGRETGAVFTISANHLEFRVFLLDVVYHVDLVYGISLGRVLRTILNAHVLLEDETFCLKCTQSNLQGQPHPPQLARGGPAGICHPPLYR